MAGLGLDRDPARLGEAVNFRLARLVEIGVRQHDQRRLAAECEQDRLEMFGGVRGMMRPFSVLPVKLVRLTSGALVSAPTTLSVKMSWRHSISFGRKSITLFSEQFVERAEHWRG